MNSVAEVKTTPAEMVAKYINLRDLKKAAEDKFAEFLKEHYGEPMQKLEVELLNILNQLGSDSISSPAGTVYKKESVSVTIADQREFKRHVIGDQAWDLIDWRANRTAVNTLVENEEPLPPGINRTTFWTVGIRRKS